MQVAKRIMRCVKGTLDLGLFYMSSKGRSEVIGYSDSDWGGDLNDRKSTSGYAFMLGSTVFFMVFKKAAGSCTLYMRSRVCSSSF